MRLAAAWLTHSIACEKMDIEKQQYGKYHGVQRELGLPAGGAELITGFFTENVGTVKIQVSSNFNSIGVQHSLNVRTKEILV